MEEVVCNNCGGENGKKNFFFICPACLQSIILAYERYNK